MGTSASRQQAAAEQINSSVTNNDEDVINKLTEAQLDEFREAFAAFDSDGGGSIDADELKMLMASVGQVPTDDELAEMIRIADADGSGTVDLCRPDARTLGTACCATGRVAVAAATSL